ncbi:hypothetical protein LH128_02364 [Sphingomonas sp. LH128]|jgi:hypothetical protein|nr:hypothetical protein LH128_02364 [Sphingomonas sp. LH128]
MVGAKRKGIHTESRVCLIHGMFQLDLFASGKTADAKPNPQGRTGVPGILERLTEACERPRYAYMVLNLIAQASSGTGSAGPYVVSSDRRMTVREWLCDAIAPIGRRDPNGVRISERVRKDLAGKGELPDDHAQAEQLIEEIVRERLRASGLTNVSRAVSELVRAGLLHRHYQGYRVDHQNRGAQRLAVYTLTDETRQALKLT